MDTTSPSETIHGWSSRKPEEAHENYSSVDFLAHLCVHLNIDRDTANEIVGQWVKTGLQERLVARHFGRSRLAPN